MTWSADPSRLPPTCHMAPSGAEQDAQRPNIFWGQDTHLSKLILTPNDLGELIKLYY